MMTAFDSYQRIKSEGARNDFEKLILESFEESRNQLNITDSERGFSPEELGVAMGILKEKCKDSITRICKLIRDNIGKVDSATAFAMLTVELKIDDATSVALCAFAIQELVIVLKSRCSDLIDAE